MAEKVLQAVDKGRKSESIRPNRNKSRQFFRRAAVNEKMMFSFVHQIAKNASPIMNVNTSSNQIDFGREASQAGFPDKNIGLDGDHIGPYSGFGGGIKDVVVNLFT